MCNNIKHGVWDEKWSSDQVREAQKSVDPQLQLASMVHQLSLEFTKDCSNNSEVGAWFDNAFDSLEDRAWRDRMGFATYNSNLQVDGDYYAKKRHEMLKMNYPADIVAEAMDQPSGDLYRLDALANLDRTMRFLHRLFYLAWHPPAVSPDRLPRTE